MPQTNTPAMTEHEVQRQLAAMGSRSYDVAILDPSHHALDLRRNWTAATVLRSLGWFRFNNQRGRDVIIRPCVSALVFVDDLGPEQVQGLCCLGLEAALVVETSRSNFQAWVRVSHENQPPAVLKEIAATLAYELGTDRGCIALGHFGRMAGLLNRKPAHARDAGGPPLAQVVVSRPKAVAARGQQLVRAALRELTVRVPVGDMKHARAKPALASVDRARDQGAAVDAERLAEWVRRHHDEQRRRYVTAYNASIVDFQVAREMLRDGVAFDDVVGAIAQHSPDIARRKAGHILDYARRTAQAAFKAASLHGGPRNNTR